MSVTIYLTPDGKAVVRWPAGLIPDSATVRLVAQILDEHARKVRA